MDPPEGIRRKQIEVDRLRIDERIRRRQQVPLAGREPDEVVALMRRAMTVR